jgi:hypothetical protein
MEHFRWKSSYEKFSPESPQNFFFSHWSSFRDESVNRVRSLLERTGVAIVEIGAGFDGGCREL